METLIMALQLLLSLSLLIITHEGGHFFFAKLFGIRVEKFYLFFDPWFSLFSIKKGETEYGIGWLPLGGYVKIAGMIDESMDTEQMNQPVQEWEFRAKPAWQRLLVMLGGVLVNFITAPIIFWLILYTWGTTYMPLSEAHYGMEFADIMHEAGFQDGDKILSYNGQPAEQLKDLNNAIIFENKTSIEVDRNGEKMTITLPDEFFRKVLDSDVKSLCAFRIPVIVDSVIAGGNAEKGGLLKGDSIVSINGIAINSFEKMKNEIDSLRDQTANVEVFRNDSNYMLHIQVSSEGLMGFYNVEATQLFDVKTREYGFLEAFPAGISWGAEMLSLYVKQLPMIFTKEGATKVGGFGSIGKMFPTKWNWRSFWFNTAFLALILGFMNVLPIPALDGGHAIFCIFEMITGRKLSENFMEKAQTVGMILLFALLIYANGADIVRYFLK